MGSIVFCGVVLVAYIFKFRANVLLYVRLVSLECSGVWDILWDGKPELPAREGSGARRECNTHRVGFFSEIEPPEEASFDARRVSVSKRSIRTTQCPDSMYWSIPADKEPGPISSTIANSSGCETSANTSR